MSYIESAEDVEKKLQTALEHLRLFEEDVPSAQAWSRVVAESPNHPVLMARRIFVLLTVVAGITGTVVLALPFITPLLDVSTQRQLPLKMIQQVEISLGFPLPAALLGIALGMALASWMAGMAVVTIGREAPMLAWEEKEHDRLSEQVKRLSRQKSALLRDRRTPIGAPSRRLPTPAPSSRVSTPSPPGSFLSFDDGNAGGGDVYREEDTTPFYARGGIPAPAAPYVENTTDGFGVRMATILPDWSRVMDPWLRPTLDRCVDLARSFPKQARLEFNVRPHMPFTLIIERATPAMAVRAMSAYIEFLAAIPTPKKGRIELHSIGLVDRNFRRNVLTVLETHFGTQIEVDGEDDALDIAFLTPDPGWDRWPDLPLG